MSEKKSGVKDKRINYIKEVGKRVSIDEGEIAIENFLIQVYFNSPIPNKDLARKLLLPIPLVTAMKKEYIKLGIMKQESGIKITPKGVDFVENEMGYKGLKKSLYDQFKNGDYDIQDTFKEEIGLLGEIFENRPKADVSIDQAHCTPLTSIKRSILALKYDSLINKKILCVGDDDLVSISLAFLIKKLFDGPKEIKTEIHVVDIDKRYLDYIEDISKKYELPIKCHNLDLKSPMKKELVEEFDCFYTDPPYTMNGMSLFLSRGIAALKKKKGLPIFFSFAHKSYNDSYKMLQLLVEMGVCVNTIIPNFNLYEGGAIIGNVGQLMIFNTTDFTSPTIKKDETYQDLMYTREVRMRRKSNR